VGGLFDGEWFAGDALARLGLEARDFPVAVLAKSHARILKERGIRRRKVRWLAARLTEISKMELKRDHVAGCYPPGKVAACLSH
jgi:hypothetical protein